MPKQVGKVELYHLFECGFDHEHTDREELLRHAKEVTDAALNVLRDDLKLGMVINVRMIVQGEPFPVEGVAMQPFGNPWSYGPDDDSGHEGSVTVSDDGRSLLIVDKR